MSDQIQQRTASQHSYNPEAQPPQNMDFYNYNPDNHVTHTHSHHQLQHVPLPLQQQLLVTPTNGQVALSMPPHQQDNMQVQSFGDGRTDVDTICKNVNANMKQLKDTLDNEKTKNHQLEEENGRLKRDLLNAGLTICSLNNNTSTLDERIVSLQTDSQAYQNLNLDLNQKLSTSKQKATELRRTIRDLEKTLENENISKLTLQNDIRGKDQEINNLRIEIQSQSKEIEKMSGDLSLSREDNESLKNDKIGLLEAEKVNKANMKSLQEEKDKDIENLSKELKIYKRFKKEKIDELAEKAEDLAKAKLIIVKLTKENKQLTFQLNTIVELNQRQNSSLFKLVSGHGYKNRQQTYKRGVHDADEYGESSKKKRNDAVLPTDCADQQRVDDDDDDEEQKVDQNNSRSAQTFSMLHTTRHQKQKMHQQVNVRIEVSVIKKGMNPDASTIRFDNFL